MWCGIGRQGRGRAERHRPSARLVQLRRGHRGLQEEVPGDQGHRAQPERLIQGRARRRQPGAARFHEGRRHRRPGHSEGRHHHRRRAGLLHQRRLHPHHRVTPEQLGQNDRQLRVHDDRRNRTHRTERTRRLQGRGSVRYSRFSSLLDDGQAPPGAGHARHHAPVLRLHRLLPARTHRHRDCRCIPGSQWQLHARELQ